MLDKKRTHQDLLADTIDSSLNVETDIGDDGNKFAKDENECDAPSLSTTIRSGRDSDSSSEQQRKRACTTENDKSILAEEAIATVKEIVASSNPSTLVELHKESRFGIEEYMMESYQGFSGIFKDSYSDFMVQEISTDGQVIQLNDCSVPSQFNLENEEKKKISLTLDNLSDFIQQLSGLLECNDNSEKEFLNHLSASLTLYLSPDPPKEKSIITTINAYPNKDHRTKLHTFLRFYPLLDSDTNEQRIRIHLGKNLKSKQRSSNQQWPSAFREHGDYVLFHLYKENMDTLEAIRHLSHFLRIPESHFGFAGTKDKRAITIQQCTVLKTHPKRLLGFKHPRVKCGHFRLEKEPLKLGDLNGNQFRIRLRHVHLPSDMHLDSVLKLVEERGIINYFGMQRFGTGAVSSYEIGLALLQQNYEKAMELIMAPRLGDSPRCTSARLHFAQHKEKTPLEMFPKHALAERAILRALPCTPEQAIKAIPIKLRTMYVHAYQSYIWNKLASERIRMGKKALLGDLIAEGIEVNEADALTNLNLKDIMLPLPGHSIIYPSNTKHVYQRLLENDGLNFETFQNMKDWLLRLPGGYRPLIVHPQQLSFSLISPNESDVGETMLDLQFQLPSSSYATMVLRELLRSETSSSAQALQSTSLLPSAHE